MKVLLIDNYDSFVYNLAQYVGETAEEVLVRRNDELTVRDVEKIRPDRIIISPGPGTPVDERYFGICTSVIKNFAGSIQILGVCLGHQGIVHAFGGRIVRAGKLRHGKTSLVRHDGKGVFSNVRTPLEATRYHSLVAERRSLPSVLEVTAESTDDHEIMGVRHRDYRVEGVQFHPESIMTTDGKLMIRNFLSEEKESREK